MIHSFSLKNFYSFKDENRLNFAVHEKAPKTEGYFTSPAKLRLSKTLAVFGHNASGKTNLLKSLPFLQWFITSAFSEDPEKEIPIKPFVFSDQKQKPIELSVDFEVEGRIYHYFVKLTDEKVSAEELKEKGTTKFKALFSRKWNEETKSYNFSQKFGLTRDMEKAVRKNCSVIATAIRFSHKKSLLISDFWKKVESNVFEEGKIDDKDYHIFNAAEFFHKNKELKKRADELIAKFDIGLSGIEILRKKDKKNDMYYEISGLHTFGDKKKTLDFSYESAGTQKLFGLLKNILTVLSVGGVAVLDEFDTDLHPAMVPALIDLFLSKETNPYDAQIIFSAHNPQMLNKLDKYQIAFVEKDKNGCSEAWRLDEMRNVRTEDNYYAKYLAGAYGAVPNFDF